MGEDDESITARATPPAQSAATDCTAMNMSASGVTRRCLSRSPLEWYSTSLRRTSTASVIAGL
eukprot:scaffold11432_cov91-Phaeocystis_antarctica.AAC.1